VLNPCSRPPFPRSLICKITQRNKRDWYWTQSSNQKFAH
jgi:hypothetical protein